MLELISYFVLFFTLSSIPTRGLGRVDVRLSIRDDISEYICNLIDNSYSSIEFAVYLITDKNIVNSLLAAKDRGVDVKGIVDESCYDKNDLLKSMKRKKILKIRKSKIGIMHHKFIIVDRKVVVTGSYNYTYSANFKNEENIVTIYDLSVVAEYLQEFTRLYY